MMKILIQWSVMLCLFITFSGYAQTIKTGVLVYGNQSSAIGAALQSAKSGAKTVLLFPQKEVYFNHADFRTSIYGMAKCVTDTILKLDSTRKLPIDFAEKMWKYLDSVPNLMLIKGLDVESAQRKGKTWHVMLNTKTLLKADALVDATYDGTLAALAGAKINPKTRYFKSKNPNGSVPFAQKYTADLRTALQTGFDKDSSAQVMNLLSFLPDSTEHLVLAGRQYQSNEVIIEKTADFNTGQAAGVIAAYASFFKDQTPKITQAKMRVIQSELLNYQMPVFDLADVTLQKSYWRAVQHSLLCGFFVPEQKENTLYFHPEKEVHIQEIQPLLQQYFFKTAIWLEDHPIKDVLSVEQAIELVCYLGNKGLLLSKDRIQRNWNKVYGFGTFNPKKNINRAAFSILVKDYLMCFETEINIAGKIRE